MRNLGNYNKKYQKDDLMRTSLQPHEGKTMQFTAIFEKYGKIKDGRKTMLVSSVKDCHGGSIADHVWIKELSKIEYSEKFLPGDILIFTAMVVLYVKGYKGYQIDKRLRSPIKINYGLAYPKNVLRLSPSMC